LERAASIKTGESDSDIAGQSLQDIQEAKKLMAQVRKQHLPVLRQLELDKTVDFFNSRIRQHARPAEAGAFDNLVKTAQRAIGNKNSGDFESHLDELRGKNFMILWRQDWFVIDRFKWLSEDTFLFPDANEHAEFCKIGRQALQANDIDKLRQVVAHLDSTRIGTAGEDDMVAGSNILVS
jgi:molecular chaperone DnaK